MKLINKGLTLICSLSFSVVVIFMAAISAFNVDNRIYLDVLTDEQFFSIEKCPFDISPVEPPPAIWGPSIRPDFYGHEGYCKHT